MFWWIVGFTLGASARPQNEHSAASLSLPEEASFVVLGESEESVAVEVSAAAETSTRSLKATKPATAENATRPLFREGKPAVPRGSFELQAVMTVWRHYRSLPDTLRMLFHAQMGTQRGKAFEQFRQSLPFESLRDVCMGEHIRGDCGDQSARARVLLLDEKSHAVAAVC